MYFNSLQKKFWGQDNIYINVFYRVDNATVKGYVDLAIDLYNKFPSTIAGFDLVGQEDLGVPLKDFIDELLRLNDEGIPLFYHAGETGNF